MNFDKTCMKSIMPAKAFSICVLLVITINMIFIGGKRRNFGLFVSAFFRTFNGTSMFELNMVGDSYSSLAFILMPFFTSLIAYWNNAYQMAMFVAGVFIFTSSMLTSMVTSAWMLFITHTLLHGIGSGLVLATVTLVVADYFNKRHPYHVLATSLASSGAYGVLILTPVFAHFIQVYGWRVAFQIIGVLFVIEISFAVVFFVPVENKYSEIGEVSPIDHTKWKFCTLQHIKDNNQTIIWFIDRALNGAIFFALLMNLTEYRRQSGMVDTEIESGSTINIMLGIGECLTFTITMLIGDHVRGKLVFIQLIGACFSFLSTILMRAVTHSIAATNVVTIMLGGSVGMANCVLYASSSEAMNIDGSISLPMSKMMSAVGALMSPIFSGLIIDYYGFEGLFVSLILLTFLRIVGLTLINIMLYQKRKDIKSESDNEMEANETTSLNELNETVIHSKI